MAWLEMAQSLAHMEFSQGQLALRGQLPKTVRPGITREMGGKITSAVR